VGCSRGVYYLMMEVTGCIATDGTPESSGYGKRANRIDVVRVGM
jgi:hypothetical protein